MKNVDSRHKQSISDPIIVMSENGRSIRFLNPQRQTHTKVHVDGGAITAGSRCDYLLTSADETIEHFIELKGTDVKHAIEQLAATITHIGEHSADRHSYVVSTNLAPALRTLVQKAKLEFKRKYSSTLDIKAKVMEVKLN